ncbi:ATP synthase F1 subunit gamma [Novisyntrophococcus fermenticellae]|uniref:ATP synthase F1 subunit gamma n=1 Tax=Novisyntrophococcus fermenticellae TaxID=2068655 RepID=UPI001E38EC06|nr:ATP synthase F1 subunit gamma [Novisyntrophococcus fermenticellae]
MANIKEVQDRIKSIQDTMKITNAMYMISSSNLKKAKKALEDTEPYFYTLQYAITRILRHMPELEHKYFDMRSAVRQKDRKIGIIVVTSDKGMAGAYNHNVVKRAEEKLAGEGQKKLFVLGELGRQYFQKHGFEIETQFHFTVQKPTMHRARVISEQIVDMYNRKELDEVYIIYTQMENSVSMETHTMQLLPLKKGQFQQKVSAELAGTHQEDIRMVPSPDDVLNMTVPNYITGMIYGALVESYSSEQNSRMMAMQSSTDNAREMLSELSIAYNRARQAAITQEITEVIGGARAQKKE